jgi:hypothetical protein
VSFAAITLCVAPQRAIRKVSIYLVIDSDQKRLDTPSYVATSINVCKIKEIFIIPHHMKLHNKNTNSS